MTSLMREMRALTRKYSKTLSARFEYNPQACIASGLDVETWLAERLLDQITLGGIGDHTPDAPSDWWVEHAHAAGCKVFPGIEGQLHWCPGSGGGGGGLRPGDGVADGFGPPSIEYMRAVAANHYRSGADGISLFNFTCADGAFARAALDELAHPLALEGKDKQYVVALWPWDAQIYNEPWSSALYLEPDQFEAEWTLQLADDFERYMRFHRQFSAKLTLEWKGLNRIHDIEVRMNGTPLEWNGYDYNHYDHGCWNDIVQYSIPPEALRQGSNLLSLHRMAIHPGFAGRTELRKCVLDLTIAPGITPGLIN